MTKLSDLVDNGATLLVAAPTPDTFNRLQQIMSGSPVAINWDELCLEIAYSETDTDWAVKTGAVYECKFVQFGIMYDENLGRSQLSGRVTCPTLSERIRALGIEAPESFTVVFQDAAQMARTNKGFIESVSYTLCAREEQPFTFGPELLVK